MTNLDPGLPQSHVDTLLSMPEKQQTTRDFFETFDAQVAEAQNRGLLINTAENKPVTDYPAAITENGLVFQLYSTERRLSSADPGDKNIFEATAADVANAALRHIDYDTRIRGGLVDLNRDEPEYIPLHTFTGQYNRLDAVIEPRQMYKEGRGTLIMFGHATGAPVTSATRALEILGNALADKSAEEKPEAQRQVMMDLAAQGSYFLLVNLHQYRNDKGEPTKRLAVTGNLKSETFWAARRRVGFEL